MSEIRSYTTSERLKRAGLVVRGVRYAIAGCPAPDIDAGIDRIDGRAEDRGRRQSIALLTQHDKAKNEHAAAVAAESAARGPAKAAARAARQQAEKRVKATEQALRRVGLA
jgi:hypothetical protein